jgi:hypothetical protein
MVYFSSRVQTWLSVIPTPGENGKKREQSHNGHGRFRHDVQVATRWPAILRKIPARPVTTVNREILQECPQRVTGLDSGNAFFRLNIDPTDAVFFAYGKAVRIEFEIFVW